MYLSVELFNLSSWGDFEIPAEWNVMQLSAWYPVVHFWSILAFNSMLHVAEGSVRGVDSDLLFNKLFVNATDYLFVPFCL